MRTFVVLLTVVTLAPASARAADGLDTAPSAVAADSESTQSWVGVGSELSRSPSELSRPQTLPALYVSLSALQIYDGYSTLKGVNDGAREGNSIVAGFAGNPTAVWTIKAGSTACAIYFAEHLWRTHRRGQAIAVMLASNTVMSVVAARNAAVLHTSR